MDSIDRAYHRWHSPALAQEMELLVFGGAGARVLVFPTSMGRFFDWEDRGMVASLGEHLTKGWIQMFCVDSFDAHSWYASDLSPQERALRHAAYDRYVLTEVIPFSLRTQYSTLEFRICDVCTRVDEAICVAAIFQAIVAKLWKLRRDNITFRVYPHDVVEENKWRAVRYGLDGKLVDFGKQQELPARDLIRELIEWFIGDVVDELGSRRDVEYAYRVLEEGSSADRQLAVHTRTGDLRAVVDHLVRETQEGVTK